VTTVVRLVDEEAERGLRFCADRQLEYTEPMPTGEWVGTRTDIGVVIAPDREAGGKLFVSYLCLASKGKRVTTRFARAKFAHIGRLRPLPVSEWLQAIPARFESPLRFAIDVTGRPIPPGTWHAAREALINLRPEAGEHLTRLELLLVPSLGLSQRTQEIFAQQKDAVAVSLDAAGLDREVIAHWAPPQRDAPWLAGITPGVIREDTMVIHDASRVPNWWPVDEPYVGVVDFQDQAGNLLSVMNVNRQPVEEIAGVDLLYYRHEPASFTLIQYKRLMPRRTIKEGLESSDLIFRPSSDRGFEDELGRMRTVEALADPSLNSITRPSQGGLPVYDPIFNYRLHPRACWIKLCQPWGFRPVGTELIKGMYLPLDLYGELSNHEATLGPQGGRVFSYERVPRWVNNTLFIELMSGGWIGSRTMQTSWLEEIVPAALSAKRSVVLAREARRISRRWGRS
jgi:hypothetical protein